MKQIAEILKEWAETNEFYETGVLSNSLKLGRLASDKVRKMVIELEYYGREALARRLEGEFAKLLEKCRILDKTIIKGCFTEDDYMQLDVKRRKVIGAVIEVAELVEMIYSFKQELSKTEGTEKPAEKDEWITLAEAARMLVVHKSTISRWTEQGRFTDNGKSGRERQLLKSSVTLVKEQIEDEEIKRDARDLRRDDPKF